MCTTKIHFSRYFIARALKELKKRVSGVFLVDFMIAYTA